MARSMGTTLAFVHGGALGFPGEVEPLRNVPALLEAIGLAHDLGNPPFGHQGETAIQTWVKRHSVPRKDDPASFDIFDAPDLSEPMRRDFLKFEGNAQAFRLLTRLQILNDDFGLNMTYAFLAALMKYPVPSDAVDKTSQARKKFNFFQSEAEIAAEVWAETGLREGVRHPLTFVMEACTTSPTRCGRRGRGQEEADQLQRAHGLAASRRVRRRVDARRLRAGRAQPRRVPGRGLSPGELDDISMQMFRVDAIGKMVRARLGRSWRTGMPSWPARSTGS